MEEDEKVMFTKQKEILEEYGLSREDKKEYPLLKFLFCLSGILEAVRIERNIKIHFALTAIVVFFGLALLIEMGWSGFSFWRPTRSLVRLR